MKKFAFAIAAVAAMAVSVPAFADSIHVRDGHRSHAEVVKKKIVVRHDRGLHRGWEHNRHHRTVVIKHRPRHVTVVKKVHKY